MIRDSKIYSIPTSLKETDEFQLNRAGPPVIFKNLLKWLNIDRHKLIIIISIALLLLGLIQIASVFFIQFDIRVIGLAGSAVAILFAALLNLIAIERGGSRFSKMVAVIANGAALLLCSIAALRIHGLQFYLAILLFLVALIVFFIDLRKQPL